MKQPEAHEILANKAPTTVKSSDVNTKMLILAVNCCSSVLSELPNNYTFPKRATRVLFKDIMITRNDIINNTVNLKSIEDALVDECNTRNNTKIRGLTVEYDPFEDSVSFHKLLKYKLCEWILTNYEKHQEPTDITLIIEVSIDYGTILNPKVSLFYGFLTIRFTE